MFDEVLELLKDTLNGAFSRDTERQRTERLYFGMILKKNMKNL